MNKQKEENIKVYVRAALRFGKFFNNYKVYFKDNEPKRRDGERYYGKRISGVLREVDALSEEEKNLFYDILTKLAENYRQEEAKKLKTLQFGYAKICRENYMAVETVLEIKKKQKNKESSLENG